MKYSEDVKNEVIELYKEGKTIQEVKNFMKLKYGFDISQERVNFWTKKAGVSRNRSQAILKTYKNGKRSAEKQALSTKKYFVNQEIFNKELTSETAWVLGLLFGDGCIVRKKDKFGRGDILIGINLVGTEDVCLKVADILKFTGTIKKDKYKNCYYLIINDKWLAESLVLNFEMTPNKSRTMPFPKISENLLNHFVRGFFDADGCATKAQKKYPSLQFRSGSLNFMSQIRDIINSVVGGSRQLTQSKDETYGIGIVCQKALIFGKWLWKNTRPEIRCEKKYQKFIDIVKNIYPTEFYSLLA